MVGVTLSGTQATCWRAPSSAACLSLLIRKQREVKGVFAIIIITGGSLMHVCVCVMHTCMILYPGGSFHVKNWKKLTPLESSFFWDFLSSLDWSMMSLSIFGLLGPLGGVWGGPYLIFVTFFTQPQFEAWKFYT